jgi:hypothetical protein
MLSEYEEMEISFLNQSEDLNKYGELIKSLNKDELMYELESLEWVIRECDPSKEECLMGMEDMVSAEIKLREENK